MDQTLVQSLIGIGIRLLLAAGVLLVGWFIARKARNLVRMVLARPQVDQAFSPSMERILVDLAFYGAIAAAVIIALTILGVPTAAILSITSAALVIFTIAFRESLANFAATIIFFVYQPFRQGEEIETMGKRGTVREIQLFNTVLLAPEKTVISLPNGKIQDSGVTNFTRLGISRADVDFTVGYGADLDRVREIVAEIMAQDPRVLHDPAPAVAVLGLADSGVRMQARPMAQVEDAGFVQFDLRERIKERLAAEDIEFAAQHHDVRITS